MEQFEKQKKIKKTKTDKLIDPCVVCDGELYLDGEYTQRIGLIGEKEEVYGWVCPHCSSEFDMKGKITSLNGENNISGEA